MATKEEIYDAEIAPLMTRIIALCKEHDIPILASFELDDDRDAEDRAMRACTTAVLPENSADNLRRAAAYITRA